LHAKQAPCIATGVTVKRAWQPGLVPLLHLSQQRHDIRPELLPHLLLFGRHLGEGGCIVNASQIRVAQKVP
jgi:hypothetical protein